LLTAQEKLNEAQKEVGELGLQLSIANEKLDMKEAEAGQIKHTMQLKEIRSLKSKSRSLRLQPSGDAKTDAEKNMSYEEVYNKRGSVFSYDESNNYGAEGYDVGSALDSQSETAPSI
jgi:hypothetical protein